RLVPENHDLAGTDQIKGRTRLLVEQIRVEMFRAHQRYPLFLRAPLCMDLFGGLLCGTYLFGQSDPGDQPALTLDQVIAEIQRQTEANRRGDNRFQLSAKEAG